MFVLCIKSFRTPYLQIGLRYLDMTTPTIRFKLVGVTMSKADVFASLIVGTLEAYETLDRLEKYYKEGNIPGNPDLIYLMTNRDISTIQRGSLEKRVAGLANVAGVCTDRRVAIGEDVALSYQGVFAMAHEVAHLLGARHDPRVSNLCPWKAGYLMSYEDGGTNKYRLSSCSMASIRTTVALEGKFTADKYCVVIEQVALPHAANGAFQPHDFLFQHDMSHVHTTKKLDHFCCPLERGQG
ncbi:hypothetical protein HPB49_026598 [Dermacentor silvarum]|nr:hypothetical protein HPB49_026598 [Dermacentor silvarum]